MIELICSFCLCLQVAMENGGNCHKCGEVKMDEMQKIISKLNNPEEFAAISCYLKGTKPGIDFLGKQGAIVSKGGKQ